MNMKAFKDIPFGGFCSHSPQDRLDKTGASVYMKIANAPIKTEESITNVVVVYPENKNFLFGVITPEQLVYEITGISFQK